MFVLGSVNRVRPYFSLKNIPVARKHKAHDSTLVPQKIPLDTLGMTSILSQLAKTDLALVLFTQRQHLL